MTAPENDAASTPKPLEAASQPAESPTPPADAALQAELEATRAKLDEIARAYSGMLNDQKDFRARLERENERRFEAERGKIALHIVQVGDELERALAASQDDQGPLARGVRLIGENLAKTLNGMGLERLVVVGQPFDPNLAEAVDLVPVQDPASDGHVVAEVAPGFRLAGKVLRAAKVRVGKHVPVAPADPPSGE